MKRFILITTLVIFVAMICYVIALFNDDDELAMEVDNASITDSTRTPFVHRAPGEIELGNQKSASLIKTDAPNAELESQVQRAKGTVTVTDEDGKTYREITGFMIIAPAGGKFEDSISVHVEKGQWEWDTSGFQSFQVTKALLGDRLILRSGIVHTVPKDHRLSIDLQMQWVPQFVLQVVDQESLSQLTEVEVLTARFASSPTGPHPGDFDAEDLLVKNGNSPLRLESIDSESGYTRVFVRARGYAWKRALLTPHHVPIQRVELQKSSSLAVTIDSGLIPEKAILRFSREPLSALQNVSVLTPQPSKKLKIARSGVPFLEFTEPRQNIFVDGLEPGVTGVFLEIGDSQAAPLLLGSATIELVAGQKHQVKIEVDTNQPMVEKAVLAGTLNIHPDWEMERLPFLYIRPLGPDGPKGQGELSPALEPKELNNRHSFVWDAGTVTPGRYEAVIPHYAKHIAFKVSAKGNSQLKLDIGAPVRVVVKAIAKANNEPIIRNLFVKWHGKLPLGAMPHRSREGFHDYTKRESIIRCPEGDIEISVSPFGYRYTSKAIIARAQEQTVVFRLERAESIAYSFYSGDVQIRLNSRPMIKEVPLSKANKIPYTRASYSRSIITRLVSPGRYRVEIGKIPGYKLIPPREIQVKEGEHKKLRYELVKEEL